MAVFALSLSAVALAGLCAVARSTRQQVDASCHTARGVREALRPALVEVRAAERRATAIRVPGIDS